MTKHYDDYEKIASNLIQHLDKKVVIGVPLGLGKPVGLLNALYRQASVDTSIQLTILTALTLSRPELTNELEKRFVEPFLDRVLNNYEDLLYEKARERQALPSNIRVIEFFLSTAKFLHNEYVQQNYISTSYTTASRDVVDFGLNVLAQQVSHSSEQDLYSLSCNSDLFHDVISKLNLKGIKYSVVAEVNNNLPFMHGEAVLPTNAFTDIVDTHYYRTLFSIPHDEISKEDHLIGLYTSTLIKDDSCLQIGIGKLSNALTAALIMRHNNNSEYRELIRQLSIEEKFGKTIAEWGSLSPFTKGLYASTEMLCDGYLQLYKENILKKTVYDHIGLQRLLNAGEIQESFSTNILDVFLSHKIIHTQLTAEDFDFLSHFGIFKTGLEYHAGSIILSSGASIDADLSTQKAALISDCLGNQLKTGKIVHAAFFLGSSDLYKELNNLSVAELETMDMTSVARTNSLFWNPELLTLQRQHTRFVNSAMMVTLGSVVISDGLINLQEVSGVGGQFDFVDMAAHLPGSRSIINCRSVRTANNQVQSNIVWDYANMTIPRFLRDIVITEYGIADCRGKTDADVIKTMLNVTDSRFQETLLASAKKFGKIAQDYQIPSLFKNNLPTKLKPIVKAFQAKGYFKAYPFGTEFTEVELVLKDALLRLKKYSRFKLIGILIASFFNFQADTHLKPYLIRMQLEQPKNLNEWIYKKLLQYSLSHSLL